MNEKKRTIEEMLDEMDNTPAHRPPTQSELDASSAALEAQRQAILEETVISEQREQTEVEQRGINLWRNSKAGGYNRDYVLVPGSLKAEYGIEYNPLRDEKCLVKEIDAEIAKRVQLQAAFDARKEAQREDDSDELRELAEISAIYHLSNKRDDGRPLTKIDAIKAWREITHDNLRDAKNAVEDIMEWVNS